MIDFFTRYGYAPDIEAVNRSLQIISQNLENSAGTRVLKDCFSMMDLTTLKSNDTPKSVMKLVRKVNEFRSQYPDYPNPASVCVYPNFAPLLKESLSADGVHITVVAACFPTAQSFLEVKLKEVEMAVEAGADEVDIVLALNSFLEGDFEKASGEISAVRDVIDRTAAGQGRRVVLKVILETGLLVTPENIANASFLAMEAGADFIKTSTGKVEVNATPMAAYIMCECISAFFKATGRKVGFKAAGGMTTASDAVSYYSIVGTVLGKEWLNKNLFRLGVSRMANNLISEVEQETVSYF